MQRRWIEKSYDGLDTRKGWMRVKAAKVEGRQGRGRPRFGWLDGVKRALAITELGLQEATQLARERSV